MKYCFPFFFLLLLSTNVFSQILPPTNQHPDNTDSTATLGSTLSRQVVVKGLVKSAADGSTLPGATVFLQKSSDSSAQLVVATDVNGRFRFERVGPGQYSIKVNYIGFKPYTKAVRVLGQPLDVGMLALQVESTTINEVVVVGRTPMGEQKGDTTQFNANAFKTAPDASAQDLVQKMPGITVEGGQVQAQGETVQRVLIDGKPFFGDDVDAALQNLPASVIANIQIFDKKSDKAELSGFDDGERIRTINIVTKPEARKGQFGKVQAGYGTDNAYMVGASVNFFKNDRRLTVTGLSNNINNLSFSADPDNNGDSRTQDGIIKSNLIGLNYSNTWLEKVEVAGSYSFNHRNNEGTRVLIRDYVQANTAGQIYSENRQNDNISGNHRFNLRLDYEMDERNRFRMRTRGNLYQNDTNSFLFGRTANEEGPINQTENTSTSQNTNYNFNNNLLYSHRFLKKGRSVNFRLNNSFNTGNGDRYRLTENIFLKSQQRNMVLRQYTDSEGSGYSWETDVSFTEPLGRHGQVELGYEIGLSQTDSDQRTYDFTEPEQEYRLLDTLLSNTFENEYLTQETEVGYRYNNEKLYFQMEGQYQQAKLMNKQQFPRAYSMDRTFTSFLPSARLRYKFTESNNLELNYDTRTNAPSLGQLQDVINNTDPLRLSTGNPNLKQSFRNWFRARYRSHNPESNRTFYASVESSFERNQISNSTLIANEYIELSDGVVLHRGAQLVKPINLNGYRDFRSYISYGQPINFISSNLNLNGSFNYSKRPGMVNEFVSFVKAKNYRVGASISSNISERIDFNISTRSSYNVVENSLNPRLSNNYFSQNTRLWYNWIFGNGFVYRTNINHQLNSGLSEGFNLNTFLWNMSIGKKLFNRQLGEISLSVYDLMNQNNNIRRNVTELFVEDVESNVLQRYFMLTFTYNIRHFGGNIDEVDNLY